MLFKSGHSAKQRGSPSVRLLLDRGHTIVAACYIGKKSDLSNRIDRLVGLHVAYLGDLFEMYAKGEVDDLYEYLTQASGVGLFLDFIDVICRMSIKNNSYRGSEQTGCVVVGVVATIVFYLTQASGWVGIGTY